MINQVSGIKLLSIIGRDTPLKRMAGTNGGEYAGACPFCGGGTDRFRVWPAADRPGFWCRVCGKQGDAIDYLRFGGMTFHEACQALEVTPEHTRSDTPIAYTPTPCDPPCALWQAQAQEWLEACQEALWDDGGARALEWLEGRGFTHDTLLRAGIGFNAAEGYVPRADWGLEAENDRTDIWLPRGIVIPWMVDGAVWKAAIRCAGGSIKYASVSGSSNALYNVDELECGKPAVLVEGAFDALAVQQEAGIAAVAAGTTSARGWKWVTKLTLCEPVLIALDADEAGDAGARWWCDVLQAPRWRPLVNDPADMLKLGLGIKYWVEAGLEAAYASV